MTVPIDTVGSPAPDQGPVATVRVTHVTGIDDLPWPDPTEDYHEASRMYPGVVDPRVTGASRLELSVEMRVSAGRSVKRHPHKRVTRLPPPSLGAATLSDALASRRSRRTFGARSLRRDQLATLLGCGYGVTGLVDGTAQALRTVPSGGALYPLELYVACQRVAGLAPGVFHYDPLRHVLELLRPLAGDETDALTPYTELTSPCAALILVTAMFWRSRFKYGERAYRFTLLEAGHVAQNVLLAAAALGLAAVPLGGFYDRRADEFLRLDGLDEATLYLIPVGPAAT